NVTIRLNARDQSESGDEANRSADEQYAGAAGTRLLIQFRLHRDVHSASNCRLPLFAAEFANPVIGVQRAEGDSHSQSHSYQSDQFSAHDVLLLSSRRPKGAQVIGEPLSIGSTRSQPRKFPESG